MYQHTLTVGRVLRALLRKRRWVAAVHIGIDRVVNYFDAVLHVEHALRAVPQVIRNRGDAVALLDRVAGDRQVRSVKANQRDIRTV